MHESDRQLTLPGFPVMAMALKLGWDFGIRRRSKWNVRGERAEGVASHLAEGKREAKEW